MYGYGQVDPGFQRPGSGLDVMGAAAAGAGTVADVADAAGGFRWPNPGMAAHNHFVSRADALRAAGDLRGAEGVLRSGNRVIGAARALKAGAPALGVGGAALLAAGQGVGEAGAFGGVTQAVGTGGGAWAGMAGGAALGTALGGPVGALIGGALGGIGGAMGGSALASGLNRAAVDSIETGGALSFLDRVTTTPIERAFNAQQRQIQMQMNSPAAQMLRNEQSRREAEARTEMYRQLALQYMVS
jgi:hypothetical protein